MLVFHSDIETSIIDPRREDRVLFVDPDTCLPRDVSVL